MSESPLLLKAVQALLSEPADIQQAVDAKLQERCAKYNLPEPSPLVRRQVCKRVISNYSYTTGVVGGATGMINVIPGLGSVIAAVGGATADLALSLKFQVEMVLAIAHAQGRDITNEAEIRQAMVLAGLGMITKLGDAPDQAQNKQAMLQLVREAATGTGAAVLQNVFVRVSQRYAQKGMEKLIPFGVGAIVGFGFNKGLTWYIGKQAMDYYLQDNQALAAAAETDVRRIDAQSVLLPTKLSE